MMMIHCYFQRDKIARYLNILIPFSEKMNLPTERICAKRSTMFLHIEYGTA